MKSKIEDKIIELIDKVVDNQIRIIREVNRIADHLNSQDQEEEDNDRELQIEMANSYLLEPDEYVEDTPEEFAMWVLRDVESWIDLGFESHFENRITRKIQQLLEEKKREGMEAILLDIYHTANSELTQKEDGEKLMRLHDSLFERYISKLNNKKK